MLPESLRFSRILRRIVFSLASAVAVTGLASAQVSTPAASSLVTNRLTQPIVDSARVTLKGTVHPLANAQNDRGAASDSMPLERIQVVLKRSSAQESALRQLITDMHTKGSASYHKWLTPDQFGQQFGPSDQDIATLEAWLQSKGFSVSKVNAGKGSLEMSGSVAQFRNAFQTQIHKYVVNGETHYANATDPQIPAALAPVFGGFATLNNFRPKKQLHVLGKATYNPKNDKATPQWTIGSNGAYSFVLAPSDYAVQYDLSPLYTAGTTGSGQTIAIINDSNINIANVNNFRSIFGLSANPPQVIIDGNDPGVDGVNNPDGPNYDSVEAYLDVEWAGAVAPAATVDLVIGADTELESGLFLAAEHAVYGNIAPVVSLSFGACEAVLGSTNTFLNALWQQAAAQGITVTVSTGDSGSAGCDNDNTQDYAVDGVAVSGYASTPYNIAVGGTDFYYSDYNNSSALSTQLAGYWNLTYSNSTPATSLLGPIPEQPWNSSQYGLNILDYYTQSGNTATTIAGGSGGASSAAVCSAGYDSSGNCLGTPAGYPKPAWQTGTGVPSDSVRDIPDVSLFASSGDNASYYPECYADGDCQAASSGSTVQITGVGGTSASAPAFAGIMALVNQLYGRQGQADFVLYPLAAQFPAAFHDVVNGTNSVPCNISSVTIEGSAVSPLDCIAVSSPISVTDFSTVDGTAGATAEGQLGSGTTASYNATTGYDLATGLGTVDANVLVTDWNKVSFASSTVTLTSPTAGTSITHGTAVTFTGTVTGTGTNTPTGNVAIETDSTTPLQAGVTNLALTNGSFNSTSIDYLPGGTYHVWANYGGDNNNSANASAKTLITVNPEASSLYLAVLTTNSSNQLVTVPSGTTSIPYGTQLILDGEPFPTTFYNTCVNVSSTPSSCSTTSYSVPTGTVTFADNGTTVNTALVNAEGDAEFYNPAWTVGTTHSVTASYSGDSSYNSSSASAISFAVAKASPAIFLTTASSNATVNQGQSMVINILVEGGGVGAAPTGTVTISGGPSGTPTSATLSASTDPNYGVTAGVATITIPTTAPTTSMLVPEKNNRDWLFGGGTALACIVLLAIPARRRSWRSMLSLVVLAIFSVGITIGCGGSSGSSTTTTTTTTTGTTTGAYTLSVTYSGDSNYNSISTPATLGITVATASTLQTSSTAVTNTSTSTSPTAAIGSTVTVTGVTGHPAPTGTVSFYAGVINSGANGAAIEALQQGTLTAGTGTTSTFSTTFDSQSLPQGVNLLTVQYSGDTVYAPSSTTISLTNSLADFTLIPAASPSAPGTATLNLTSVNGFADTVSLTCSATGVTCSLAPTSVALSSSSTTGTATLTVSDISGTTVSGQVYSVLVTGTNGSGNTVHTISVQVVAP